MNKFSLLAATLLACGGVEHDHAHGNGDEHDHAHGDAKSEAVPVATPAAPGSGALDDLTVSLDISGTRVKVSAERDHAVQAGTGELRAVLTDAKGTEHRITLSPTETGWEGDAPGFASDGAVAVLTWKPEETVQTARLGWGTARAAASTHGGHDHGGHDHGGHDHGSHDHGGHSDPSHSDPAHDAKPQQGHDHDGHGKGGHAHDDGHDHH